jgi:hypothetical protein
LASIQIPQLPPALALNGTEELEIVQQSRSMRATALQLATLNALQLVNDISSNASYYPLYSVVTNTKLTPNPVLYTSDTHYNYNPEQGRLTAQRVEASQGLFLNSAAVTLPYEIPNGDNAMSMGPIMLSSIITVPTGSVWGVI